MNQVIKMDNDFMVEIEIDTKQAQEISCSNNIVVNSSVDKIQNFLTKVMKPVSDTYRELNKEMNIDSAKVKVGVKIDIEGNFILAKSSASANIEVEMTFKPLLGV